MGPLPQILRSWAEFAAGEDKSDGTIRQYRAWLRRFAYEELDSPTDLLRFTTAQATSFLASLRGPSRGQAKRALRHFSRFAQAIGWRDDDPTLLLGRYRRRRGVPDFLTLEELTRLVYSAACHSPEWAWAIVFIFATGGRIGEACRVRPADVDLLGRTVTFRQTKTGEDRMVLLGPTGLAAATALMDSRPTLLGVSPSAIRRRLHLLALRARIPERKVHPHALRHTCGTQLSERGATQVEIMEHLGHRDPAMAAWYVHVTSERARRVAGLL